MNNYVLNLTEIGLKDAVRCIDNNSIYFSVGKHIDVKVLTHSNLSYSINENARYYASRGIRKL